jgi:DNA-binding MarR family transcriptional regulator
MGKKGKGKGKGKSKGKRKSRRLQDGSTWPGVEDANGASVPIAESGRSSTVAAVPLGTAITPTELAARLANLSTVLQRQLARSDAGGGLTRARLSALALLVLGGPRTLGELAAAEHVRPPTMTRLVHAMEADDLVVREPNPKDRRSVIIGATHKGEALLEQGRSRQIAPLAKRIAELSRDERASLEEYSDLLGRLLRDADRTSLDEDHRDA